VDQTSITPSSGGGFDETQPIAATLNPKRMIMESNHSLIIFRSSSLYLLTPTLPAGDVRERSYGTFGIISARCVASL
jgi:hypothetical protein